MTGTTQIETPTLADAIVLEGVLTRADHETYKELPFDVPPGVDRVTVEFAYTGREEKAVIDLGLFDPERFRGWSGGDKARFSVSTIDATPSYLPGPIVPGRWTLLLGVPNIRPGREAHYVATIRFGRGEQTAVSSFARRAARGRRPLVPRRPAHAHLPLRRLGQEPVAAAARLARSTRRSSPRRPRASTSSRSLTTTPSRITMRCASYSRTSIACCSSPASRSPPSAATPACWARSASSSSA